MTSTNSEEHLEVLQWVGKSWEGQQLETFWKKKIFFRVKVNFLLCQSQFKLNSSLFFLIRFMISSGHQGWLMMFQDLGLCQLQVKGNYLFFFSARLLPLTVSHPVLFTVCHWSHSFILMWCKLLSGVDSVSDLAEVLHKEHHFAQKACNLYFWNDPCHCSRQDCWLPFKMDLKAILEQWTLSFSLW